MARKKKSESPNPGLTPSSLRDKIRKELTNGEAVQGVRKPNSKKDGAILPKARPGASRTSGASRVFGADAVHDEQRGADREQEPLSDPERAGRHLSTDETITEILRQIVYGNDIYDEDSCPPIVKILRKVVLKAQTGEQAAIDFVTNRIEGKPGQAAKKTTTIEDVEKMISQAELARLDEFMGEDNDTPEAEPESD